MRAKRIALSVWLLGMVACVIVVAGTRIRTDMAAFLPRSASMAQQALTDQVSHGAASHLILVALTDAGPRTLAALSAGMAARLRRQRAFVEVANGDARSFAGVQSFVWRNRYLLGAGVTSGSFTVAGLHAALTNDLALLGSPLGALVQATLPGDPTGTMLRLMHRLGNASGPPHRHGVWFSPDGSRALLLIHTRAPGFRIDAQQHDLMLIRHAFDRARAHLANTGVANWKKARLLESGPGVFAVHVRDMTKRDVTRLSLLATAGAVCLLLFAYRSPRVLLLGLLPVASGALAAIAVVSLVFGFVHGVTLGFGVTLIGESLDYAIYLFTQTTPGTAARDTLARIWPTLRLGALTSVVGFSAMLFSNFVGFEQLGLFSIVGLIVAAGVTRFVLPHLVPYGFFAGGADVLARPLRLVIRQRRRLRQVAGFAVLAGVAALALHRGGFWDENLMNLSPVPAADQALAASLQQELGVPAVRYFAVFRAAGEQRALDESEALGAVLRAQVAKRRLGGFAVPSALLPSAKTQRARQAALPDASTLRARFDQAQAGLPFRPDGFAPFFRAVAATRHAPKLTRAQLPPPLALQLGTMLVRGKGFWTVVAPLHNVTDPHAIGAALGAAKLPGVALVDLNRESGQLLHMFQREAVLLAAIGSVAILAVLLDGLQAPGRVARVAAPLFAAVIVTAALLTLDGHKLSIFMVVGFLLIVAVGSNYCLFFEQSEQNAAMRQRTVASIVLANLCTVSAYGLMSLSGIPVLHDIGITVAIGTFLSLLFAAVLIPAGIEAES